MTTEGLNKKMNPEIMAIQKRLKDYLYVNKISQRAFAHFIGKSEITISRWLSWAGKGLNFSNARIVDTFLKIYKTPPLALRHPGGPYSKEDLNQQDIAELMATSKDSELIRSLIIRRIVLMDANVTKDKILKTICTMPLEYSFNDVSKQKD